MDNSETLTLKRVAELRGLQNLVESKPARFHLQQHSVIIKIAVAIVLAIMISIIIPLTCVCMYIVQVNWLLMKLVAWCLLTAHRSSLPAYVLGCSSGNIDKVVR